MNFKSFLSLPFYLFASLSFSLFALDPNAGTLASQSGAMERLLNPSFIDVASPVIAFLMVIVLPTVVALWVIIKTLKSR